MSTAWSGSEPANATPTLSEAPSAVGWCRSRSDTTDAWLRGLFETALADAGRSAEEFALLAVGGYGRQELCPASDVDVVLLHRPKLDRATVATVADRLWYPVWDAGWKLGHSVRTPRDALRLAADDLDTATSLLSARRLSGDAGLAAEVIDGALAGWRKRSRSWLERLAREVEGRHGRAGEVAFLLEPDLKEGRGGLRDVHALGWAESAGRVLLDIDHERLAPAYELLLSARVALQQLTARPDNVLRLQEQDAVAQALGLPDADALMAAVSSAARTIAWTGDDCWRRITSSLQGPRGRAGGGSRPLADGVVLRDGEVGITADADPAADPVLALRAGACAAEHGTVIDRGSLERLAQLSPSLPDPWPDEARRRLVDLLASGPAAVRVIEALDQRSLWVRALPEWEPVRSRPQRNAYHRFTVDRHLVETAAGAAALVHRVRRPDLLLVGALLHDLGKGYPGDHTTVGMELIDGMARRMGFADADVATLVAMCEHHLLLPDVAVRRDLDDPGTIDRVARAVGNLERLELLAALTEADSIATGPSAWGPWKAGLLQELVARSAHVLEGGAARDVVATDFPSPDLAARMIPGQTAIEGDGDTLTVISEDRPGLFSRVAGVLALHGLDVLAAQAYSSDPSGPSAGGVGVALARFVVEAPAHGAAVPWGRVTEDLERVLAGRLALPARLAERARTYTRPAPAGAQAGTVRIAFDEGGVPPATVVEVEAPDAVGLLYRITRALSEFELDIRAARIQTLGPRVVDTFYVRDSLGSPLDGEQRVEVERAVRHAVEAGAGL